MSILLYSFFSFKSSFFKKKFNYPFPITMKNILAAKGELCNNFLNVSKISLICSNFE